MTWHRENQPTEQSAPKAGALGTVEQFVKPFGGGAEAGRFSLLLPAFSGTFRPPGNELPKWTKYHPVHDDRSQANRRDAK